MMTGTCIIVREAPLIQGIKPSRVSPRKIEMALRIPAMPIFRVLC
jgi:hypothetical protein